MSMNIHEYDKFRAGKKEGIAEGIKEGIKQGTLADAQQKAVEAAENMMKKNYPIDDICEITGLSLEQILDIKEKIAVKA